SPEAKELHQAATAAIESAAESIRVAAAELQLELCIVRDDGTMDSLASDFTNDALASRQAIIAGAIRSGPHFGNTLCLQRATLVAWLQKIAVAREPEPATTAATDSGKAPVETTLCQKQSYDEETVIGWMKGEIIERREARPPEKTDRNTIV